MYGNRSNLLNAITRTTLEGGEYILKRALGEYVRIHSRDVELADAMEEILAEIRRLVREGGERKDG